MTTENKISLNDWVVVGSRLSCHFIRHKKSGEMVLISNCWGTVHSNDLEDCHCKPHYTPTQTKQDLSNENQFLKSKIQELEETIINLQNKLICQKKLHTEQ